MLREALIAGACLVGTGALPPGEPVDLRVMTFNIWRGGTQVDLQRVIEAIRVAQADVVGLQEAEGHARVIADALGWAYVDERLQIVSRYPLIDPPDGDGVYLFVEPRPGQVVAMSNVHLLSDPYGPDAVRDGARADSVLALERALRLPEIRRHLDVLPRLAAGGFPVILTGDFNAPSHRDWTAAMVKARKQVRYPLAWPVSSAIEKAGFRDSYRAVYPDPVKRPGLTWTPGYPPPHLGPNETFDRIDQIWTAGKVTVLGSRIVGEVGGADVDASVTPWPSDHRAVVSTLRVTLVAPPVLVAVNRRAVTVGDEIVVSFHAPGHGERIVLATMSQSTGESPIDGSAVFGTTTLAPGDYQATLVGADGKALAAIPFAVLAPGARPELRVERAAYAAGQPIVVRWRNAPGFRWDWVGVYPAGETDLENYILWRHTGATISGSMTLEPSAFAEPLAPGRYEVRLFKDDGYSLLAAAPFTVGPR